MRRMNEQDGAVAVLVALLLVVLLGFGAISVDVGQLYQERRELQNGADAAAMAAAHDCAKGVVDCSMTGAEINDTIDAYASANANDGESEARIVALDLTDNYVTVETETLSGGDGFLTHWFASVLGRPRDTVRAMATASWDRVPGTLQVFPLAFCLDRFNYVTNNATTFGPPEYHIFYKKNPPDPSIVCTTSEGTYPGGFGWLDVTDPDYSPDPTTCMMTISVSDWAPASPGSGLPNSEPWPTCVQRLEDKIVQMDSDPAVAPILVPIFDKWKDNGANGKFHIAGFGAFRPTGFHLGGSSYYPDKFACGQPDDRCLRGWFTDFVTTGGSGTGGAYYGVVSVDLVE